MAVVIVATPGAADANSFATLTEANTYLEARLNATAFTEADTVDQNIALVEATRELNTLSWAGLRASGTQALALPRSWMPDPDPAITSTGYVADDEIPGPVVEATIELALEFLRAGTEDLSQPTTEQRIERKKVDVLETAYFDDGSPSLGLGRFPRIMALVSPYLAAGSWSNEVIRS